MENSATKPFSFWGWKVISDVYTEKEVRREKQKETQAWNKKLSH